MTDTDLGPLKEYLAVAVAYIIDTRVEKNRPPFMATMANIRNVVARDLEAVLEEMLDEKVLTERRLLNDRAFEFTPPKQSKT